MKEAPAPMRPGRGQADRKGIDMTQSTETHLWDVGHPYYASEGNYYRNGHHELFTSWADFVENGGLLYDGDDDLNFVWRWDWKRADPTDWSWEIENDPDFEMPGDDLFLYYMLQRKAICTSVAMPVTEADGPAVREWLTARAEKVRQVWAPLLDDAGVSR